ncbi:MAG: hypothetical protein HYX61_06560 [Gammaproteobacteria bacterium]|nr:hypothetical protein [Gammaproteobacteria bacterium]
MKALTLSSYEFIPVCLPFKPSEFTISLPKSVQAILEKLNRQGYWAVVVGGAVRDHLLNAEPNDFDIISNCPKDKLTQILKISSNESIFVPGLFEFDTEDGHEIDLVCTQRSLIDELKTRDLSINTLIADRYGIVYDLLGKKEDLRNNYLVMMGDINDRLEEDPSRICRLVRICAHLGKGISAEYAQAMLQKAPLITRKLGFGAYVKSLETLFLRGEAKTNLKILLKLGLMPFLTPGAQSIKNDLTIFIKFLNRKSYHLDMTDKGTRKSHFKGYHIIALLLIPELLDQINDQRLLGDAIDNVLNAFCLTYEGAFSDQEKTQFNSIKQIMIDYYLEYVNYQARHKAHLRASQAKQKNIPTASSSQSVPLIKRKQNKPTLIQFQDYVKAAEYTSEQTNNKKNSSSRNRDKNLKRI